jgi:hypothetical protein
MTLRRPGVNDELHDASSLLQCHNLKPYKCVLVCISTHSLRRQACIYNFRAASRKENKNYLFWFLWIVVNNISPTGSFNPAGCSRHEMLFWCTVIPVSCTKICVLQSCTICSSTLTLCRSLYISQIHMTSDHLFLWIYNKCAHVLLSSCLRCNLEACGLCFVFLVTFVWLHLAVYIWVTQRDGPCYWSGVRLWRGLWIACTELMQRMSSVVVRWYCLMM